MPCRIVPTSFNADDENLKGFPLPAQWRWKSCETALSELRPHGVMMRLPLFWQLETPLWYACRTVRAPIFLNDPENMPVGAAALTRGGIDMVVAEQRDAAQFANYLQDEGEKIPAKWLIVHRAKDAWLPPAALKDTRVAQEVHMFPGFPILSQCGTLMTDVSGVPNFHRTNEGELSRASAIIMPALGDDVIESLNLQLPDIDDVGICKCGRHTYRQRV